MKKSILIGAAALTIALTGCTATQAPTLSAEQPASFASIVGGEFGQDVVAPARTVARGFCTLLDSGVDYESAVLVTLSMALDNGITAEDLGVVLGAGTPEFCPEHIPAQNAWIAANQ